MDLRLIPGIVRRRFLLILLVAAVATSAAGLGLRPGKLTWETQVRIQLTTPQNEDVALLNGYRASNVRDEATLARNNFLVVLKSPIVYQRTLDQLQLSGDAALYDVTATPLRDTDFIDVTVKATSPEAAEAIANEHVAQAIKNYGELRAKAAGATRSFLAQELQQAAQAGGITPTGAGQADAARESRDAYQALLKKYSEAALVEQSAQKAGYIQVVSPATAASKASVIKKYATALGLAIFGGLGLGLALACAFDATRRQRVEVQVPTSRSGWAPARPVPTLAAPGGDAIVGFEPQVMRASALMWAAGASPEEAQGMRVRRALKAAGHLLRQAERQAIDEDESLGSAIRVLRSIVFDGWRELRNGASAQVVADGLRSQVDAATHLLLMAAGSSLSAELSQTDLEVVAADVLDGRADVTSLADLAGSTLAMIAVVRALAVAIDEPGEEDSGAVPVVVVEEQTVGWGASETVPHFAAAA